ncbi:MAG: Bor family protein [Gemmatimonadota bacterium]
MRRSLALLTSVAALVLSGCYHAVVTTGRPAGDVTINKPWANSFVYGLVPPPVTETAQQCKGGVAKVETQQSFLNGLVGGLTFGLYTPMTINVTCASSTAMLPGAPALDVGTVDAAATFEQAIKLADKISAPVYLKF